MVIRKPMTILITSSMWEKESLLDFKTPLKFIFSHSALKEGWII